VQTTLEEVASQSARIAELEEMVNADQAQMQNLRNIAVVSMGLMLGVGGIVGLIVGVAGATLVSRRKRQ
jgi:hypothetical protein